MFRFLVVVVPPASRALARIRVKATRIPDPALRAQALASIDTKAYHVQGGCIFATFLDRSAVQRYIELIAPLETIYDYLDNVCDRLPDLSASAYRALHEALLDAVDDRRPLVASYYRNGPQGDDGGYLAGLVAHVRAQLAGLPHYASIRQRLVESATLYTELQTLKHGQEPGRAARCSAWYERNRPRFPGFYWWEFAAACGSSLPVFALIYMALQATPPAHLAQIFTLYLPYMSTVHILLDYYIDQAEDREFSELNFIACYATRTEALARLRHFVTLTNERINAVPDAARHRFVLHVMSLFYLTHPKVFAQNLDAETAQLLAAFDAGAPAN